MPSYLPLSWGMAKAELFSTWRQRLIENGFSDYWVDRYPLALETMFKFPDTVENNCWVLYGIAHLMHQAVHRYVVLYHLSGVDPLLPTGVAALTYSQKHLDDTIRKFLSYPYAEEFTQKYIIRVFFSPDAPEFVNFFDGMGAPPKEKIENWIVRHTRPLRLFGAPLCDTAPVLDFSRYLWVTWNHSEFWIHTWPQKLQIIFDDKDNAPEVVKNYINSAVGGRVPSVQDIVGHLKWEDERSPPNYGKWGRFNRPIPTWMKTQAHSQFYSGVVGVPKPA